MGVGEGERKKKNPSRVNSPFLEYNHRRNVRQSRKCSPLVFIHGSKRGIATSTQWSIYRKKRKVVENKHFW